MQTLKEDIQHLKIPCMRCNSKTATERVLVSGIFQLCLCEDCLALPEENLIPAGMRAA